MNARFLPAAPAGKAALALAAALLAVACLLPGAARAQALTLSYANFPPAPTFPCVQMERWAQEVRARTQGKVEIQTYPGSTLLGAKNMWSGVIQGQADIGCISMAYQPGVFPMMSVFEQPLGFSSATAASMALWELYAARRPEEFARVKVLTLFASAPSNIMCKEPVTSLAQLKGMELRASGGASLALEILGATPVSMPASETPEALQKGLIKGVLSSFDWLKDFNFAEHLKYQTVTNLVVYPFAVIMNLDKWNALPDDVKAVFDGLSAEQAEWTGRYLDAHVRESLDWAREKHGIEVIELPRAELDKAEAELAVMIDAWKERAEAKGVPADAVLAEVRALRQKHDK
ncbi:TRAP transporter substrate-binding protein [Desulfocurvus sp.]|jgi:TRAP-type C4-dicarboxylate transport system substrate-binding protein|uniref:TRAP transporter substrate-binding protein n=1 Tax=Desulfocurvus sp. TaxID=2871698 RepID=UPI0025BBDE3F|nr:TRAP transporter substrate-binding protein [Desulfocurvus sp.]MCK9239013.1 TRAP transporter substrate-binding protein [Desulfocurvus sp.]